LLLEKLIVAYLVNIFSACDGTQRFMNMFKFDIGSCPEPDESSPYPFFFKICFNIIQQSMPIICQVFSSIQVLLITCVHFFFSHTAWPAHLMFLCVKLIMHIPSFLSIYPFRSKISIIVLSCLNMLTSVLCMRKCWCTNLPVLTGFSPHPLLECPQSKFFP